MYQVNHRNGLESLKERMMIKNKPDCFGPIITTAIIFLIVGFIMGALFTWQSQIRVEKIQAENRVNHKQIKEEFIPMIEMAIKALEGYERIVK